MPSLEEIRPLTELELRVNVISTLWQLSEADTERIFSAAKGLMESRVLSDPTDVQPALRTLDALIAYFTNRP